ncbi:MAG: hypothetical protein Q9211_000175 [Gyalolechia sp. 1 TL-2023]
MDANAYLTRQGWRGNGHALHPSGHGINKPLLVSRRTDRLGVGKKAHDAHADQWWARAFDETLRSINVEQSMKETIETNSATVIQTSIYATKRNGDGGLYGSFVRGQGLEGTISSKEQATVPKSDESSSKTASFNGSARIENKAGKKSSGHLRTKKHFSPRGQGPIISTSPQRSIGEKTVPPPEAAKGTKSLKSSDEIVPDPPSRFSDANPKGDIAQRNHGSVTSNAVALQRTVDDRTNPYLSDNGATHRVGKRDKNRKKGALRAAMIDENIDSESSPEQQIKTKKRR